ncbi:MAG: YqgE/AlgH family protein [Myxococcales bacterium]|nr:YqgE/AlgH family protein [Myxococcales bacterium]MCB9705742.1 YqgE/AlgH family protein [Myxococcales bacterium]
MRGPHDNPVATSLAHHLLCAVPQLVDPNFVRSVILMIEHGDDGAFGLVVNNPLPTLIAEVTDSLGLHWRGPGDQHVLLGGPVETVRGFVLHDQPAWDPLADEVVDGIHLTATLDGIDRDAAFGGEGRFLFTLGYAGWGAGQLEREMVSGSWVAVPVGREPGVSGEWLLRVDPEVMWQEALAAFGIDPARLVGHRGIGVPVAKA